MNRIARVKGFSLFELVVVISLISILLVIALWRLIGFVREAERVAVLTLESQIRNVLLLETAKRILNPDGPAVLALAQSNPMDLMLETPINYLGELNAREITAAPRRHWFFDSAGKSLVYRSDLMAGNGELQDVTYDIEIAFTDSDGDGDYSAVHDRLLGVRLYRHGGSGWLDTGNSSRRSSLNQKSDFAKIAYPTG